MFSLSNSGCIRPVEVGDENAGGGGGGGGRGYSIKFYTERPNPDPVIYQFWQKN